MKLTGKKIYTSHPEFELILEICDDFFKSKPRCIHCCKLVTPVEGVVCDDCYDPMNYLDGDDE